MLPHSSVGGNTILTEIDEHVHTVGVHGLVHENIVVVVVGKDLLDGGSGAGLEFLDCVFGSAIFLEFVVDGFDVGYQNISTHNNERFGGEGGIATFQVRLECILGGLHALLLLEPDKTELVLNVVDHDLGTLATIIVFTTLGGRVGTLELEVFGSFEVFAAVSGPEDRAVFDDLEGVGDDFIIGDDVLATYISCAFL